VPLLSSPPSSKSKISNPSSTMFAGGPHDQPSDKEIREGESKAAVEVQIFTVACIALWFSPHVIEWARKLL